MRGVPPFTIEEPAFTSWRIAVGLLAGGALLSVVPWLVALAGEVPLAATAAAVGALVIFAGGLSVARRRGLALEWTGQSWRLGGPGAPVDGTLDLCIDLGAVVLLRFLPAGSGAPWRATWLPLAAGESPAAWHALRCALHAGPSPSAAQPGGDG